MENMEENLEDKLRRTVRRDIIMRNQMRSPINYEAERLLEMCVSYEVEEIKSREGNYQLPQYNSSW